MPDVKMKWEGDSLVEDNDDMSSTYLLGRQVAHEYHSTAVQEYIKAESAAQQAAAEAAMTEMESFRKGQKQQQEKGKALESSFAAGLSEQQGQGAATGELQAAHGEPAQPPLKASHTSLQAQGEAQKEVQGLEQPNFDPTMSFGAGLGAGFKLSVDAGKALMPSLGRAISAGLVNVGADVPISVGADVLEVQAPELVLPFTVATSLLSAATIEPAIERGIMKSAAKVGKVLAPEEVKRQAQVMKQILASESGMVEVWHGSPYRFDKMTTEKIGTGEGAQAFGYGLYFTDKKEIAQHYAQALSRNKAVINGIEYSNEDDAVNAISNFLRDKYKTMPEGRRKDVAYFTLRYPEMSPSQIIQSGISKEITPYHPSYTNLSNAIEDSKKLISKSDSLYRAQLFPGKSPDQYTFLDWYEPVDKKALEASKEILKARPYKNAPVQRNIDNVLSGKANNQDLYLALSGALGSDKEASLFLKRAGIDGIRYPTETLSGKGPKGGGGFNYVVFDDKDVRLVSRESGGITEQFQNALVDDLESKNIPNRPMLTMGDIEGMFPGGGKKLLSKNGIDYYETPDGIYALSGGKEVGFATPLSEDISQGFDVSVATEVQRKGIGATLFKLFRKQNPDYPTGGLTKAGRGMLEKLSRESGGVSEDLSKQNIIKAYNELKEERGYGNIEIADIRDKAGVSQEEIAATLKQMSKDGEAVMALGERSAVDDRIKSGGVAFEAGQEPNLLVRIDVEKPQSNTKITGYEDGLKRFLKGNPAFGKLDADAKLEWLREHGRPSDATKRNLRYEYHLSDGRVVSAETALKETNPKAYEALKQRHKNLRSAKARIDIYKSLPDEIQKEIIDDIPYDEVAKISQNPTESLNKWFKKEGHLLNDSYGYDEKLYRELTNRVYLIQTAEKYAADSPRQARINYTNANRRLAEEGRLPEGVMYEKDGRYFLRPSEHPILEKYGWRDISKNAGQEVDKEALASVVEEINAEIGKHPVKDALKILKSQKGEVTLIHGNEGTPPAPVNGGKSGVPAAPDMAAKSDELLANTNPDITKETAGNIRLWGADLEPKFMGEIETPEDIMRVISGTHEAFADQQEAARRGVRSWEETAQEAKKYKLEDLLGRKMGQALNAEQVDNARTLLVSSADTLKGMADLVRRGQATDMQKADFMRAFNVHYAIQMQLAGAAAEAGRALQIFRKVAQADDLKVAQLKDFLSATADRRITPEKIAEKLSDMTDPAQVSNFVKQAKRATTWDMFIEAWINGLLSGPTTHAVNVSSNVLTALWMIPERLLASGISQLHGGAIRGGEVAAQTFGLVQGFKDGLKLAAQALRKGEGSDILGKIEGQERRAITGANVQALPAFNKLAPNAFKEGGVAAQAVDALGNMIRIPGRFLTAEDELFKSIGYRMELQAQAYRKAAAEGLDGKAMAQRIQEIISNPQELAPEVHLAAVNAARYQTFTNELGGGGKAIQTAVNKIPGLKLVVPFIRTPANILKFATERTPLAPLMRSVREDIIAGGARRDMALAKISLGSMAMATVAAFASAGHITGGGPTDTAIRSHKYNTGWQPYSIKIGDKYYAYGRLEPIGMMLGLAADAVEIMGELDEMQSEKLATTLVAAFSKNVMSKTWLRGLSEAVSAMEDPDRYGANYVKRFVGSMVPTLSAQIERSVSPEMSDARTMLDAMKARIPGFSKDLPTRRNIWGEKIEFNGALGPDIISPIYTSTERKDAAIDKELMRLKMPIRMPRKVLDFKGAEYPYQMDGYEYEEFVLRMNNIVLDQTGKKLKTSLNNLVTKDKDYKEAPDSIKELMIKRYVQEARERAKQEMYENSRDIRIAVDLQRDMAANR